MNEDFIVPLYKYFNIKGLVFLVFKKDTGYLALEHRHSIRVHAKDKSTLALEVKNEVDKHFRGKFEGKITLREFIDEEICI